MTAKRPSILGALFIIVLHALLPLLAIHLYVFIGQRQLALEDQLTHLRHLTQMVANTQERQIGKSQMLLSVLAQLPSVKNKTSQCNTIMADLQKLYPSYANIGAADAQGNLYCSAVPPTGPVNGADRAYFKGAMEGGFAIGEYQIGRVTGVKSLNMGYPIKDEQGKPVGVVFAGLKLDWLNEILTNEDFPPQTEAAVIDGKGLILTRVGENPLEQGTEVSSDIKKVVLEGGKQPFTSTGPDGVKRIYAYTQLQPTAGGTPTYFYIGLPEKFIYLKQDNLARSNALFAGLMVGLALSIAYIDWRIFLAKYLNAR